MAMKKYAQGEGELEVLRGEEAVVAQHHLAKTGKSVADFNDDELKAFRADIDRVRGNVEEKPAVDTTGPGRDAEGNEVVK